MLKDVFLKIQSTFSCTVSLKRLLLNITSTHTDIMPLPQHISTASVLARTQGQAAPVGGVPGHCPSLLPLQVTLFGTQLENHRTTSS